MGFIIITIVAAMIAAIRPEYAADIAVLAFVAAVMLGTGKFLDRREKQEGY